MTTMAMNAVELLVSDAQAVADNRREEPRHPYFVPVTVSTVDGDRPRKFSAFSREVSLIGIGLLHNMVLSKGTVILTISRPDGAVTVGADILWCRPCGEGWYLSGARFWKS